jgi:hypothetical protein
MVMDSSGNLYIGKALADALRESGANEVMSATRVVKDKAIAKIAAKRGAQSLSEDELRHLAGLPRRERMATLAELRRR